MTGGARQPALRVIAARKSFGRTTALDGVDLEIEAGTLAAVLGPSGCGKTTLLRAVAGFERLDDGIIELDGTRVEGLGVHLPPEVRRVGVVPQEGALFPHLTVEENVAFGLPRRERSKMRRVRELLELVDLVGLERRRPHELSGGQQQRAALARCLAPRPQLVLLDEPFAALDASLRVEVREQTRTVLRECGASGVLVTHDQEEALSLADVVLLMRSGRVVQAAPPPVIYRHPADTWVASFVGHANLLPGMPEGSDLRTAIGAVRVEGGRPGDRPGRVLLRPEQLRLVEGGGARVVTARYVGHESLVELRCDGLDGTLHVRVAGAPPSVGTSFDVQVVGAGVWCPEPA